MQMNDEKLTPDDIAALLSGIDKPSDRIIPLAKQIYNIGWDDGAKASYEHLKMCEEEQSGDLISRDVVLDTIHRFFTEEVDKIPTKKTENGEVYVIHKCQPLFEMNKAICKRIKALPSASPTQNCVGNALDMRCDDAISRQKVIDVIDKWAKNMGVLIALPASEITPLFDSIHDLPLVNPQKSCDTCKFSDETDGSHCYECVKEIRNHYSPKYCDRNICISNEYNGIGCDECEVTKSQEKSGDLISREQAIRVLDTKSDEFPEFGEAIYILEQLTSVRPQETGHCKDCKWWKDSDGVFRRGIGAESQCPMNRIEVYEGNGYCYMFEPQESEEMNGRHRINR